MSRSVKSVGMKIAGGQEDDYLESLKSVRLWKEVEKSEKKKVKTEELRDDKDILVWRTHIGVAVSLMWSPHPFQKFEKIMIVSSSKRRSALSPLRHNRDGLCFHHCFMSRSRVTMHPISMRMTIDNSRMAYSPKEKVKLAILQQQKMFPNKSIKHFRKVFGKDKKIGVPF